MSYNQNELDMESDFNQFQAKRYPFLKFISAESSKSNAPVKHFVLLTNDEKGNLQAQDLGETLKVIFLKRGKFKLRKASYTTNEVNSGKNVEIEVYRLNKQTGKRQFQDKGEWRAMKEKYGLATFQYPYVMLSSGDVAKLAVLPSSLGNYWEYCDSFAKEKTRIQEYETVLKGADDLTESEGGTFYKMTFSRGIKNSDELMEGVVMTLKVLNEELKQTDDYFQKREQEYREQVALPSISEPNLSEDDIPIMEDEEINPEEVPY